MKKIIIAGICGVLALTLVGCSSNNDGEALNSLNLQLDKVNNIVSSTSTSEVNLVSPLNLGYTQNSSLQEIKSTAYSNMMREEEIRQDVLALTGYLKSLQSEKYKLGNSKATALNYLTSNLAKYSVNLQNTKSSVRNNVEKIKKFTSVRTVDANKTRSCYTELNNLMQERAVYLNNLYNTMVEICEILNDSKVEENKNNDITKTTYEYQDNRQDINNKDFINQYDKTSTNERDLKKDDNKKSLRKNIDSYNNGLNNNNDNLNTQTANPNNYNNDYYYNYNNPNMNNEYYYRNRLFNPNRNTDTFYPRLRNIDTYRYNPNDYVIDEPIYRKYPNEPIYHTCNVEDNQLTENNVISKNCEDCDNTNQILTNKEDKLISLDKEDLNKNHLMEKVD